MELIYILEKSQNNDNFVVMPGQLLLGLQKKGFKVLLLENLAPDNYPTTKTNWELEAKKEFSPVIAKRQNDADYPVNDTFIAHVIIMVLVVQPFYIPDISPRFWLGILVLILLMVWARLASQI